MNDRHADSTNLFALVTYAPEPLQNWLQQLREELHLPASSEPHITILPPRPLTVPVDQAREQITELLASWRSFDVELTSVRMFDGTNVLYLEVGDGNQTLRDLHSRLNSGDFAHEEIYPFHPHVTIGGPIEGASGPEALRYARQAWDANLPCSRQLAIREVAFVSIAASDPGGDWQRLWAHTLRTRKRLTRKARAKAVSQTS